MDPQSSGTPSHLWCIFDCRTKVLKARSRFLHSLGNHSNLPEIFPTDCTFVAPAHFTEFMGPGQICFMCLESNPKRRELKRKENNCSASREVLASHLLKESYNWIPNL